MGDGGSLDLSIPSCSFKWFLIKAVWDLGIQMGSEPGRWGASGFRSDRFVWIAGLEYSMGRS